MALTPSSGGGPNEAHKAYPEEFKNVWQRLTRREKEVAELTARGLKQRRIASALHIKPGTVAKHRNAVASKIPGAGTPQSRIARAYAVMCGASTEGVEL